MISRGRSIVLSILFLKIFIILKIKKLYDRNKRTLRLANGRGFVLRSFHIKCTCFSFKIVLKDEGVPYHSSIMSSCNLCGRRLLDRSVPFGYKIALPMIQSNINDINNIEERFCKYLEVGITTKPIFNVEQDDIVVKLSDVFGHCAVRRGNEITMGKKEWDEIVEHRDYVERFFANVPVIQRFMISNTLTMYFETFVGKKCVCLTREICEERATILRITEQTMTFLFSLSKFIDELHARYVMKVPYVCYVFEKFLYIIRSSVMNDVLERTEDNQQRKQLLQKYVRNHWFFDETSTTHNELINFCSNEMIDIILNEKRS